MTTVQKNYGFIILLLYLRGGGRVQEGLVGRGGRQGPPQGGSAAVP